MYRLKFQELDDDDEDGDARKKISFFSHFFLFATWHIFFVAVTVVEWNKKNSRIRDPL